MFDLRRHSQSFGCGLPAVPSVVLPFVFVLREDSDKEILWWTTHYYADNGQRCITIMNDLRWIVISTRNSHWWIICRVKTWMVNSYHMV